MKDKYKYWFMFISLIYLGGANSFTNYTMSNISLNPGYIFIFVITLLLVLKYKIKFTNIFLYKILAIIS